MTIFLTGGAGKTSRRVAAQLVRLSPTTPVICSSRNPPSSSSSGSDGSSSTTAIVKFDWLDPSTYLNPFKHPLAAKSPITAIYIVLPASENPLPQVQEFIHVALEHTSPSSAATSATSPTAASTPISPLTLVLLSSDTISAAADHVAPHGRVHNYLIDLSTATTPPRTQYAVLRPTFFMENFSEEHHVITIRDPAQRTIFSATGSGGAEAFVSSEDIAAVAVRCLLGQIPLNRDFIITGPQKLTYPDIAAGVSKATGLKVTHSDLSTQQLIDRHVAAGMPEGYAAMLSGLDERIRNGLANEPTDTVEQVTGRPALSFGKFAETAKKAWL